MATPKAPTIRRRMPPRRKTKPIWELIDEIMADVPDEELDKLPRDGAKNLEHYLHGAPKAVRQRPARRRSPAPKPIQEVIEEIMSSVPDEELARLPRDGAAEHDHYIYGTPKSV